MLLEPPYNLNGSSPNPDLPIRWRYMKHACGENPRDTYKDTRMDINWRFREAYKKASDLKKKQDDYCELALAGKWEGLGAFPQDLQWEALVDVVRGRVKGPSQVANSRYLLYEAQQAYYYGLPENLAISSVTSTAAEVMGLDHRVGYIQKGMDADLVIWDSHPLALGATPTQVFIDGIPQLESVHIVQKPQVFHNLPKVPNFDKEAGEALQYEGLPPLAPTKRLAPTTVFTNLTSVYMPTGDSVELAFSTSEVSGRGVAVVRDGSLVCSGAHDECLSTLDASDVTFFDLEGGSIAPGLTSFGSPLGLHQIQEEDSTNDGDVFDPLVGKGLPNILGGDSAIVRAVDGLQFGSRDA
ncbi:hypothetical protein C0991_005606 [Blastosporella zonata]|nr:hypothetical protein C0991_005606 [Blastosporella zonata]